MKPRAKYPLDLSGSKFGRLEVISKAPSIIGEKTSRWICKCECGTIKNVRRNALTDGGTVSCGCWRVERAHNETKKLLKWGMSSRFKKKHGHASGGKLTREYYSWSSMLHRCYTPSDKDWKYYGGRGVTVCNRWRRNFKNFLSDMGGRPIGKTLDRINPWKNYTPKNCRWATHHEQGLNKRLNHARR